MTVTLEPTPLSGLLILRQTVAADDRGYFMEVFVRREFSRAGLPTEFLQDNQSHSKKNVIRGLHFQWDPPQGKLIRVAAGEAFVVAVDIRKNSSTQGKWFGKTMSPRVKEQLWAPPGFATGFCALVDDTDVQYKCTAEYNPARESGIRWNDPNVGITWPAASPVLSPKDASAQLLSDWLVRPESESFRL